MFFLNNDFFLMFWALLVLFLTKKSIQSEKFSSIENKQNNSLIYCCLVFLPIIIFVSFSDARGDTLGYLIRFKSVDYSYSEIFQNWNDYENGQGFLILNVFLHNLFGYNEYLYRFSIALIQSIPIIVILKRYSYNYALSIYLLISSLIYSGWMMNGLRQFTAVCIIFLATPLLEKKKYIPLVLVVLLATTIHQTAIIFIPIIFVASLRPFEKKTILLIVVLSVLLYFYVENSGAISDEILKSDDGAHPLRVLFNTIPVFLSIFYRKEILNEGNRMALICVNMSFVTSFIYFIAFLTSGIMVGRLPIYTELYNLILIPYLLENFSDNKHTDFIRYIIVGIYFLYFCTFNLF